MRRAKKIVIMKDMELKIQEREKVEKSTEVLRREGYIPAVFYGRGMETKSLFVSKKDFTKTFRDAGTNTVITLLFSDGKNAAIIHDVQYDPISDDVLHVDFYGVRMDEKITVTVPIDFSGESPAVKEKGGVLNKALLEIEVEALPGNLPHEFVVNVGGLSEIDQAIYVKDLVVAPGVEILADPEAVIVSVTPPVKEEELAPAPALDLADVKVETEEKKAEREAGKASEENASAS